MVVTLLRQPLENVRLENRWRTPSVERRLMDRSDQALLAAFLLAAGLGTWTHCLMHDDGAVILSSGWFGNLWDLYASQIASRTVAVFAMHGPAWLARAAFDLDADAYLTVAHVLYFAVPLVLWLALRAVERDRLFSRLYLALALAMVYFPTELIFGVGVWLVWLALVSDPARSIASVALATLLLGAVMAFSSSRARLDGTVLRWRRPRSAAFRPAPADAKPGRGRRALRGAAGVLPGSDALAAADQSDGRCGPGGKPLRLPQSRLDAADADVFSDDCGPLAFAADAGRLHIAAALAILAARHAGHCGVRTMVRRGRHEPEDEHLDAPHGPLCDGDGARPCLA